MATGKNSFILYKDIKTTVDKLPMEKRGELFTLILDYVNDLNPTVDDLLLEIAFEPIKQQLKRDLKAWESIKEKRTDAGRLGGLKKAEQLSKAKQNVANVANATNAKQNVANQAVDVLVTVIDTVTVNDNEDKNTIGDKPPKPSKPKKPEFDLSFVEPQFKDCFTEWLEYKRGRKQSYKTQESLQKCYNTLVKYANGNKETAAEIIDSSIANNYSGFFEPKQKPQTYKHPFSEQVNNKHHENF